MRSIPLILLTFFLGFQSLIFAQSSDELANKTRALQENFMREMEKLQSEIEETKVVETDLQTREGMVNKFRDLESRLRDIEDPQNAKVVPILQQNMDMLLVIVAAFLVFLMQPGFCFLEMGLVRAKNSINVVMKNILDFSAAGLSYMLVGFTLMFGASEGGWVGMQGFWLSSLPADSPVWGMWFFQAMFAATACTIASGAMAERTRFMGYLVYTAIFAGLIYPIFGHWAWGSLAGRVGFGGGLGWLEALGFHDFAGSTVVHGIGGACALAGIIVVGPRQGKFAEDGTPRMIMGHSVPMVSLGALLLWGGWFGFNVGSAMAADLGMGRIAVNTMIGGCAGALVALTLFWKMRGTPDPAITINGLLGGLVGVTAGADVITPGSAAVIGIVAGIIATLGAVLLDHMKLDDVAGAVPVHLFNGIWGTIAVGLFHQDGIQVKQIGVQIFGTAAICSGAFIVAFILFKIIDVYIGLRATDEEQMDGLDFAEHATNAYPDFRTADR